MAAGHPYGTDAELQAELGADVVTALTRQLPGSLSATILADVREDADRWIDSELAQTYPVPFEASPNSPALINTLSNWVAAWFLLAKRFASLKRHDWYQKLAKETVEKLRAGTTELVGVSRVAATEGSSGIAYTGGDPVFAGLDSDGNDRTSGW